MTLPRPCLDCGALTTAARCQRCASIKDRERGTTVERMGSGWAAISRRVLKRDGYRCQLQLPGCTGRAETADHITSRNDGGSNHPDNLEAACRHCNSAKGARSAA